MEAKPDPQHTQSDETDEDSRPTTNVNSKVDAQHVAGGKVAGVEFDGVKNSVFYIYADRAASTVDSGPAHATPAQPRAPESNPFEDVGRISDPARYLERQSEMQRIYNALKRNLCVSVVAGSKMGRSSLLYQVVVQSAARLPNVRFAFVNLETCSDEKSFYEAACRQLGGKGKRDRHLRELLEAADEPCLHWTAWSS